TSPLFDQVGPHARSVADLLLFDAAVSGGAAAASPPPLKGIRLGVIRSYWFAGLDSETERVTNAALARLKAAGVELVEGELPELKRLIGLTTDQVQNHDVKPSLTRYRADCHTGLSFEHLHAQTSPDVRKLIEPAVTPGGHDFVTEAQYQESVKVH